MWQIRLWSDPAVAAEFVQAAIKGVVDARQGRGVEQGKARAERAIGQGDKDAAVLRQIVAANMTPEQLTEAESLINELNASPGSAIRRNRSNRIKKQSQSTLH